MTDQKAREIAEQYWEEAGGSASYKQAFEHLASAIRALIGETK